MCVLFWSGIGVERRTQPIVGLSLRDQIMRRKVLSRSVSRALEKIASCAIIAELMASPDYQVGIDLGFDA